MTPSQPLRVESIQRGITVSVVAKFFVQTITEHASAKGQKTIVLMPVTRGEENKEWARWTPSGRLEMAVNNEAAAAEFHLGEEYLITFEHSPKPGQ